jgi:orotate phosphoribosyltransferase
MHSAVQEVTQSYGMPVISIGNLNDLLEYISDAGAHPELAQYTDAVAAYRRRYGVNQEPV